MRVQQGRVESFGRSGLLGFLSSTREPLATAEDRVQLAGMNRLVSTIRELSTAQVRLRCSRQASPAPGCIDGGEEMHQPVFDQSIVCVLTLTAPSAGAPAADPEAGISRSLSMPIITSMAQSAALHIAASWPLKQQQPARHSTHSCLPDPESHGRRGRPALSRLPAATAPVTAP